MPCLPLTLVKMRSMSVEVRALLISLVSLHSLMKFLPSISTARCRTGCRMTQGGAGGFSQHCVHASTVLQDRMQHAAVCQGCAGGLSTQCCMNVQGQHSTYSARYVRHHICCYASLLNPSLGTVFDCAVVTMHGVGRRHAVHASAQLLLLSGTPCWQQEQAHCCSMLRLRPCSTLHRVHHVPETLQRMRMRRKQP